MKRSLFKKIWLFLLVVFFVIIVIDLSLLLYKDSKNASETNSLVDIKFVYTDKVSITNKLPLTDEVGKNIKFDSNLDNQAYLDFYIISKDEKDHKYEIYLEKLDVEREMDYRYIKIYLTDDDDKPYEGFESNASPTYSDLKESNIKQKAIKLYSGKLGDNKIKKFRLRVWVSDSYAIKKYDESFSFNVRVREK